MLGEKTRLITATSMTAKKKGKYKSNAGTFESEDLSVNYKKENHLNKEKILKYIG